MGFEAFSNLNGTPLKDALYDSQILSYRYIQTPTGRSESITINDPPNQFNTTNAEYNTTKHYFNNVWDAQKVEKQLTLNDKALTIAVKSVVYIRGKHNRKKQMKKQSSIVFKEVRKIWKSKDYLKNPDIEKAIAFIHCAYRESFVNIRIRLSETTYSAIPDTLTINIDNTPVKVKSLYCIQPNNSKQPGKTMYRLKKGIIKSNKGLRELQLLIAPYIFPAMYTKF